MAAVCFGECCYRVPGKYLGGLLYKEVLLGWNVQTAIICACIIFLVKVFIQVTCLPAQTKLSIGTPLSPSALRVMLLGSENWARKSLLRYSGLGRNHCGGSLRRCAGHQVAHRAHVINMAVGVLLSAH